MLRFLLTVQVGFNVNQSNGVVRNTSNIGIITKNGVRASMIKSSEYIPKKMESKIIRMNNEKAPVEEILKVLQNRGKRKR